MPENINATFPSIKIGLLNMMPDAALAATERQFLRLMGSNPNVNCYIYPFSIQGIERSYQAQEYLDEFYSSYDELTKIALDALVITGANVSQPVLQNEKFWSELTTVLRWARASLRSTLCSCLATHAAVKVFYDIDRQHLGNKCWGVFPHQALLKQHCLLKGVETKMDMCHSRFNDIPNKLFEINNIDVLIKSEQAGVQLAAEQDISIVYFQGHPEYDDISLLKEYKREVFRYLGGDLETYPPVPENYFNEQAMKCVENYRKKVEQTSNLLDKLNEFPEQELSKSISAPWQKPAKKIFHNWIDFIAHTKI